MKGNRARKKEARPENKVLELVYIGQLFLARVIQISAGTESLGLRS